MSNTATLGATPGLRRVPVETYRYIASLVAGGLFALLLISFQPFYYESAFASEVKPSNFNMLGFVTMGSIAILSMMTIIEPRRLYALIDIPGFLLAAMLLLSAWQTPDPVGTMRSVLFALTAALVCVAIVLLPRSKEDFTRVVLIGCVAALGLSYFGVIFMPNIAIHTAASMEPQHAGLWRGHFTHKNTAGPVMTILLFFGIYVFRAGRRWIGAAICILTLIFIIKSGSKTTLGLMVPVIGSVLLGRIFGWRILAAIAGFVFLASFALLSVGTVLSPTLAKLTASLMSDPSFTGRVTLWRTGIEAIGQAPWLGYGFDDFWMKPAITETILPFDIEWDYRNIVNGHDNYIDIALFLGIPGLLLAIYLFAIRPLIDYVTCPPVRQNWLMADLFLMIALFAAVDSVMESFWFRRADPIWLLNFIGVFGLRAVNRVNYR